MVGFSINLITASKYFCACSDLSVLTILSRSERHLSTIFCLTSGVIICSIEWVSSCRTTPGLSTPSVPLNKRTILASVLNCPATPCVPEALTDKRNPFKNAGFFLNMRSTTSYTSRSISPSASAFAARAMKSSGVDFTGLVASISLLSCSAAIYRERYVGSSNCLERSSMNRR